MGLLAIAHAGFVLRQQDARIRRGTSSEESMGRENCVARRGSQG